jgi:hypothetical protein
LPAEAVRRQADPAIAWCSRRGFRSDADIFIIEKAVEFITGLATITAPCAAPEVYANKDEARKQWEQQGGFLLAAFPVRDELRRLAARTGDLWQPNGQGLEADGSSEQDKADTANPEKASVVNGAGVAEATDQQGETAKPRTTKKRLETSDRECVKLKLQIYSYIQGLHAAGKKPAAILADLKASRDRMEQIRKAGLKADKKLVRAAINLPKQRERDRKRKNQDSPPS